VALIRWVGRAIGLDVHRDFCVVAICEEGVVRSAGRVPSTPEGLRALAASLLPSDRVALEVTGSCWEVTRVLEPFVQRVIVVSPDDTGISSARAKTDKLDARTLAGLLWKGELDAVWMPDERCQVLRRRLARREQLMRGRTRAKNEIQAVLARRLQAKPGFADLFGVKGRRWLADLELPLEERESVDAGLRQIAFLDAEIAAVDKLIARQALDWPEIRRLMTVSGVNLICAASFLAAIGEPSRFLTSRKLVAYLGLDLKGPPVRRGARTVGSDLQARVGERAVGARRGGVERGQAARPVARVLRADPRQARSRQSDRRDRPQTHRPVLVHAHPLRGLRPPASRADQEEAAPARADLRRPRALEGGCWDLEHQPDDPARRTCTRDAGRGVLQADGRRPASRSAGEKSGRERDTGARINIGPRRATAARQTQSS
jgi:transposase